MIYIHVKLQEVLVNSIFWTLWWVCFPDLIPIPSRAEDFVTTGIRSVGGWQHSAKSFCWFALDPKGYLIQSQILFSEVAYVQWLVSINIKAWSSLLHRGRSLNPIPALELSCGCSNSHSAQSCFLHLDPTGVDLQSTPSTYPAWKVDFQLTFDVNLWQGTIINLSTDV